MSELPTCEYYLYVSSQGEILGKKSKRVDVADRETWRCEYLGKFFRVTKLYPFETASRTIQIGDGHCEAIKIKSEEHTSKKPNCARHEAGHAVLLYALRLLPVDLIEIRPNIMLRGNLHEQLKKGWASSIGFIGGNTSTGDSVANELRRETWKDLGVACQGYGGLAARRGDSTGVDEDLASIRSITRAVVAFTQPLAVSDLMSPKHQESVLTSLCDQLKSLAFEIIADPIIAARHAELTNQLLEREWLHQGHVEAILQPTTMPDFSDCLEAIRREFHFPAHYLYMKSA